MNTVMEKAEEETGDNSLFPELQARAGIIFLE